MTNQSVFGTVMRNVSSLNFPLYLSVPKRDFVPFLAASLFREEGFSVLVSNNDLDARMHQMDFVKGKTRNSRESF